ncbi:MAG: gamma carbonic anhydrase family protein [Methanomassiliicoccales archaeon]|nr:MAG: gamma carbonic anhydrase family protein [Methanomassiliicoccales archaeon]
MAVFQFEDRIPRIGKETYIAESAEVIGKVMIGDHCYIGPGARLRGDYGTIEIGDYSIVEDNCVLHARPDDTCKIGEHVTVGHGAIVHNATIRDWAMIGMGSIVSDFAVVGEWSVIGEGAVVRNNQKIPDEKVAVGVPAKVIADVKEDYKELWMKYKGMYTELAKRYPRGLKRL